MRFLQQPHSQGTLNYLRHPGLSRLAMNLSKYNGIESKY
jgi:hypothetical protein